METKILEFINKIASEKGMTVEKDTDLFSSNVLDSMEIIMLLTYLQDELKVSFSPEDLKFDNFQSVVSILKWLDTCQRDH